jgi:hypothetical protein
MGQLLPVNTSAEHVVGLVASAGGRGTPPQPQAAKVEPPAVPPAPEPTALTNWEQEQYELSSTAALTLGFPVATVDASVKSQVLIFGMSRWRDVTSDGEIYRYGVSVRVLVHIRDYKADGSLTIPIVAAKVEIEHAVAQAQLLVRGYKGSDLALPAWGSFNVSAYSDYQKAVSEIQSKLSASEDLEPQLLATTALKATVGEAEQSLGSVLALEAISHGESLQDALAHLVKVEDEQVLAAVRHTYSGRVTGDEATKPDGAEKAAARSDLHGFHVNHGTWLRP